MRNPNSKSIVLQVAVPSPLRQHFDYLSEQPVDPGSRVLISFGRRECVGVVLATTDTSQLSLNKLKPIKAVLDEVPVIGSELLRLLVWSSHYYQYPIGEVVCNALPSLLKKGKSAEARKYQPLNNTEQPEQPICLNSEQAQALAHIEQSLDSFHPILLNGVTGSGKTEVYLQAIAKVLARGQQVLVLVPEIGLTPQTLSRFSQRFSEAMVVLHSGLTERERLDAWCHVRSGDASIIVATRSGIFSPVANLGLIIIDEEHDLSYKQQEGFRYSARDLAIRRAQGLQIPIVLGSATPSLETLLNVKRERIYELVLNKRVANAKLPTCQLIDIRQQPLSGGLSPALSQAIRQHLSAGNQVLLFLNRRGYAPVLICHGCGWHADCKRCDAHLTIHMQPKHLHCHHCDASFSIPSPCPSCGSDNLLPQGIGTERIEYVLQEQFPDYPLVRLDRDTTRRKGAMEAMLNSIKQGEAKLLLGTQMLAKGHHFPDVTLVALLDVDSALFSADFRASERLGQLLIQVAGRAGRADKPGQVLVQTHHTDHALLQSLVGLDYTGFAKTLLHERHAASLPPYQYYALLRAESVKPEMADKFLAQARELAKQLLVAEVFALGPIAAPMAKRAGKFRAQLLFHAPKRKDLQYLLSQLLPQLSKIDWASKVRWSVDVDPLEMM